MSFAFLILTTDHRSEIIFSSRYECSLFFVAVKRDKILDCLSWLRSDCHIISECTAA